MSNDETNQTLEESWTEAKAAAAPEDIERAEGLGRELLELAGLLDLQANVAIGVLDSVEVCRKGNDEERQLADVMRLEYTIEIVSPTQTSTEDILAGVERIKERDEELDDDKRLRLRLAEHLLRNYIAFRQRKDSAGTGTVN